MKLVGKLVACSVLGVALGGAVLGLLGASWPWVVLGAMALAAITLWLAGRRIFALPAQAVTLKLRRVEQGDLQAPLCVTTQDELGELSRALDAACAGLRAADVRTRGEASERAAAVAAQGHAQRLSTVGKLASGIAHELGTPLNVISGRAQIILADEPADSEMAKNARIIVEQTKRMTKIIRQLLDFAHPRPVQKTRVDLRSAVQQALMSLEPLAKSQEAVLEVEAGDPLRAPIDVPQLQKALSNLVSNALHASKSGSVHVRFRSSEVQPPASHGGPRAQYAIVEVRDTGHGMLPETVERIFDPFFTTREIGEGTGLGLSLAHGIVRDHGGFIDVDSKIDAGTTFTIHLPLDAADDA